MRSECLKFLLGLCLVIIYKDGYFHYITIGVGGSYKWDHKVVAVSESERSLVCVKTSMQHAYSVKLRFCSIT